MLREHLQHTMTTRIKDFRKHVAEDHAIRKDRVPRIGKGAETVMVDWSSEVPKITP